MAGRESMSSARRPRRPSSKTWNRPTGPAPTMTASVTVASFVRSGDKGFLQGDRRASRRRRGESREILLREPFGVEQARLVFRAAIAQDRDDRVPGAEVARNAHRSRHVDATRAAEEETFLVQQSIDETHGLAVF